MPPADIVSNYKTDPRHNLPLQTLSELLIHKNLKIVCIFCNCIKILITFAVQAEFNDVSIAHNLIFDFAIRGLAIKPYHSSK